MVQLVGIISLLVGLLILAGLGSGFYFVWRLLRYGQVLPYRPRRRVPWGLWGVLVAMVVTFLSVVSAISLRVNASADADSPATTAGEFAEGMLRVAAIYLMIAAGLVALLVSLCRARLEDLGLPRSLREWGSDTGLGLLLGFALIVPIYILQVLSVGLLGVDASHPILNRIEQGPDMLVIVGALLAAMIVAPIFEEIVFRLLLIGALERWEDETIDWPYSEPAGRWSAPSFAIGDEAAPPLGLPSSRDFESPLASTPDVDLALDDDVGPPLVAPGAVVGLNHGWFPILVSAFLFSLAHLGLGPSPIPLFVFGMIVGYAYQRTHRLIPCIVAHLVFNGISIGLLVASLLLAGQAQQ